MLGGKLVDSFGRKRVIVICQSLGAIMLILCGIMPISMITAKMIIASSSFYCMAFTAYDALQADVTNPKNRKIAYSLLYMGINIGFAIGPIIGGFLYKNYLSLVFIGDAVTTLVSMILVVTLIKDKKTIENTREDKEENVLEERNELEDNVEGSVFKVLIKRPILIVFGMIMFFINFTYAQWPFALPLQLGKLYGGDGAKIYGLLGAANGLIVIVATPSIMRLTRKFSELMNICLVVFLYFISFLMFGFISSISLFFLGVTLMTLVEIVAVTNSSTFISNNSPASHRGRSGAALSIITGAGAAISPMIIGSIMDNYGIIQGYLLTAGSAMILVVIANKLVKN